MENPKKDKIHKNVPDDSDDIIEFEGRFKGRIAWKKLLIGIGTLSAAFAALAGILRRISEIMQ